MRRIGSLLTAALAALLIAGCALVGKPEPNAGVASAHPGLYLNEKGKVKAGRPSLNGELAAGIPGHPPCARRLPRG